MSTTTQTPTRPELPELFLSFLGRPVDAESIQAEVAALGEVEPHEVAIGFRAEPRMAWSESLEAIAGLTTGKSTTLPDAPSEWAGLVVRHPSLPALPFATGNYPQRVRNLSVLLQTKDLGQLRPHGETTKNAPASPQLRSWAAKQMQSNDLPSRLLAVGVLRTAHDYQLASECLEQLPKTGAGLQQSAIIDNEKAAILWERGETEAAFEIWNAAATTPTTLFNRGMAALFLNRFAQAKESLTEAVNLLPESSAWHHLAGLYLNLAELRS